MPNDFYLLFVQLLYLYYPPIYCSIRKIKRPLYAVFKSLKAPGYWEEYFLVKQSYRHKATKNPKERPPIIGRRIRGAPFVVWGGKQGCAKNRSQ